MLIETGKKYELVIISASAMGLLAVSLLPLTKKEIEEAEKLGGADSGDYRRVPDPHYSDKGSHKLRSDYHKKGNHE